MNVTELFIVESIDIENEIIVLKNYVFDKKHEVPVSSEELELYIEEFDDTLAKDMVLFVEYDEERGEIIGV